MGRLILLTGMPGVGKTTALLRIIARLQGRVGGFTTGEIRQGTQRIGFRLTTLDGQEGILARVDIRRGPRVGKYGVDLHVLEELGVAAIRSALWDADYVAVDEIGKMELLSPAFRDALWEVIRSTKPLLATIMYRPNPWADEIKRYPGARLFVLTPQNRDEIVERIVGEMSTLVTTKG